MRPNTFAILTIIIHLSKRIAQGYSSCGDSRSAVPLLVRTAADVKEKRSTRKHFRKRPYLDKAHFLMKITTINILISNFLLYRTFLCDRKKHFAYFIFHVTIYGTLLLFVG